MKSIKAFFIKHIPCLKYLSKVITENFINKFKLVDFKIGDKIIKEDNPAKYAYLIHHGNV